MRAYGMGHGSPCRPMSLRGLVGAREEGASQRSVAGHENRAGAARMAIGEPWAASSETPHRGPGWRPSYGCLDDHRGGAPPPRAR